MNECRGTERAGAAQLGCLHRRIPPPAPRPSTTGAGSPMGCLRVPAAHVTHLQDVVEWWAHVHGWEMSPSHLALWDIFDPNCSPLAPTNDPLLFLKNRGAQLHAAWALNVIKSEEERGVSGQVLWRFQGGPPIMLPLLPLPRLGALINAVLPSAVRRKFGPLRRACPTSSWKRPDSLGVPISPMDEVTIELGNTRSLAGGGPFRGRGDYPTKQAQTGRPEGSSWRRSPSRPWRDYPTEQDTAPVERKGPHQCAPTPPTWRDPSEVWAGE